MILSGFWNKKKIKDMEDNDYKRKKADLLLKAFENNLLTGEELDKALKNLSHLIPKKVAVKGKDGKVIQAIRWVNPETNDSENFNVKLKDKSKVNRADSIEESVAKVLNSDILPIDKIRNLVNLGIYDKKTLCALTGAGYTRVNYVVSEETEIDTSDLRTTAVEAIKDKIRTEQATSDTPEGREAATLVGRDYPLEEIWEDYENNLEAVILGEHKFAVGYGSGGVGKTYTFEQLAQKMELRRYIKEILPTKDQYDYVVIKGKITPTQVYAEMYRHRDKLIVFDDCDSFLKTDEVQGFLKGGLDTGEDTYIDNLTGATVYQIQGDKESGRIPNTFSFTGRVIAITNLTTKDIDPAVRSRALCSNLTMTVDETMEKIGKIKYNVKAWSADKTRQIEVDPKFLDMAYTVLGEHKDFLGSAINTRMFSAGALQAMWGEAKGYKEDRLKRIILNSYKNTMTADALSRASKT